MKLEFTIRGNHENLNGNPIPKAKLTRGQQWTDKAQRYAQWKQYVRADFHNQSWRYGREFKRIFSKEGIAAPLTTEKKKAKMNLNLYFANEKHPDPENVFGSIADALFENDKHLNGAFTVKSCKEKKGRVEVSIEIDE